MNIKEIRRVLAVIWHIVILTQSISLTSQALVVLASEPRDFDESSPPRNYYESSIPLPPPPRGPEAQQRKDEVTRAAAPREDSARHYSSRDYWQRMDDMFDRTIAIAENSYKTNRMINIIVVIIGIVLIANSIVYTWYKQSPDAWSLFSGGLGLVSFVTIFLTKPQLRITKALANLVQIQMIYKSHSLEYQAISDYHWEKYKNGNRDIAELTQMNKEIDRATENAAKLVESFVEKDKEGVFR